VSQKPRRWRTIAQLVEVLERDGWHAISEAERDRFMGEMSEGGLHLFTATPAELKRLRAEDATAEEKRRITDAVRERKRIEDWKKLQALENPRGLQDMHRAWLQFREQGLRIGEADRAVANKFGRAWSTVMRQRKRHRWG
jgi:hypothetical protein